ncbi:MAG: hypothetical protein WHU10_12300 [Fimbriimonadales bacterium]
MRRRAAALASLLLAAAIVLVAVVAYLVWPKTQQAAQRPDGLGQTTLGAAKMAARDAECRSNLQQARQALQVYSASSDEPPASLDELRLPASVLRCPVGGEPYTLDPSGPTVRCVHPGHEGF